MNDSYNMKKSLDSQTFMNKTELQQGKDLLRRRYKMKKSVRIRSKDLMKEEFTNMQNSNLQQAVVDKNNDEVQSLITMQKSMDTTIKAWQNQKDTVSDTIKNNPKLYQLCVDSCRKNKAGDALTACLFGCGIGKFASSSTTYRGNKPPPPPSLPWWDYLLDAIAILVAIVAIVVIGFAFATGVGEVGLGFGSLGAAMGSLSAGFTGIGAAASAGFAGFGAIAGSEAGAAALITLGAGAYGALIYEALKNAPPGEPPAKTIMNATIKRLGTLKKPETVGDVIAVMALLKYIKGSDSGDEALSSAIDNLNNSKYAKYSGVDLTAAELQTFKLGDMNALQYYQNIIAKFGFTTPFDDLNPVIKYYYLLFLAQTKQGVAHLSTTAPPPGVESKAILDFYSQNTHEGFENNLQKYSIGSVTADGKVITKRKDFMGFDTDPPKMGSFGPVGYLNRDAKAGNPTGPGEETINESNLKMRNQINKQLGSHPVAVATYVNGKPKSFSKEGADTLTAMNDLNPSGVRTLLASSTNTFKELYSSIENDPLVLQMIALDASPAVINKNLQRLEKQWSEIFKSGCAMGISDPNYKPGDNITGSKTFAGHKQYCKGFVNTKNGRSGYYGQDTIVKPGGGTTSLEGEKIKLDNESNVGTPEDINAGRRGCDIEIKPDQSGYCICADGTKIYMDGGHPSVSCNDLCYPKNIVESGSKQLLYHNPASWKPGTVPTGAPTQGLKAFNQTSINQGQPWLQCGSGSGRPGECPDGMTTTGKVEPVKQCGDYDADPWWMFWASDEEPQLGRKCVIPTPPGGQFPTTKLETVDNGMGLQIPKGYTKLPSPSELVKECGNAKYDNLYIELLKFKVLDEILNAKTKVMGKVISQTERGHIATKMKQSAVGRQLLRDMQKYKRLYEEFEKNEKRKNQLAGMYEDINFKSQSANISYYIWFILAISGMFLVIKKLKSSN